MMKKLRKLFDYRNVQFDKFIAVLGEIAAEEERLSYLKRKLAKIDHNTDWWGWANTKQAIQDTTELLANLTARSNALRPEDWY